MLHEDGVGSVVFAHKTTEGWEALLSGMIRGGWTITASWPIATEMGSRLRARDSAALATSVHLVCRRRPENAPVGDWADVLRELPIRVASWMERLQGEGIRGADLVFACIGPALEIFSRYRGVEAPDGRAVGLAEYLEKVWEVVGRTALETVLGAAEAKARNGLAGALEEDARLTALFLWTLQATTGDGSREADVQNVDAPGDDADEDVENTHPPARPRASRWSSTSCAVSRSRSASSSRSGRGAPSRRRREWSACFRWPSGRSSSSAIAGRRRSRRGWSRRWVPERIRSRACSFRNDRKARGPPFGSGRRGTVT